MNTQNSEFLKKSLLNLGFGDKPNADLDKQIAAKSPEFKLGLQHEFNQKTVIVPEQISGEHCLVSR